MSKLQRKLELASIPLADTLVQISTIFDAGILTGQIPTPPRILPNITVNGVGAGDGKLMP